MTTAQLSKVSLFVPRSDLDNTIKELSTFDWFHPEVDSVSTPDSNIDDLNSRLYTVFLELDELISLLDIELEPGVISILSKGFHVSPNNLNISSWSDLVENLESDSVPLISQLKDLNSELIQTEKKLSDDLLLSNTLSSLSKMSFDLKKLKDSNNFHYTLFLVPSRDLIEIKRSLPEEIIATSQVTRNESVALIASPKEHSERVERVLRVFEVTPFSIPDDLPQNPLEAYTSLNSQLDKTRSNIKTLKNNLNSLLVKHSSKILSLREASKLGYDALNRMRRSGPLKNFGLIQGYIPNVHVKQFENLCKNNIYNIEPASGGHGAPAIPSLTTNKGYSKAFENITLTQGPASAGEVDPTPIISLFFPIFYGIMFADLGHGLVLFLLGLLLRLRGSPSLKSWGVIFASSGIAAMIAGILVGEVFGAEINHVPVLGPALKNYLILHVSELNKEVVMTLLVFSILIGVLHQTVGFVFEIIKGIRLKEYVEVISVQVPTLVMYLTGFCFALSFIGSGYNFGVLLNSNAPTPLLSDVFGNSITNSVILSFAFPILSACILFIVFGKAVAIALGKFHDEDGIAMSIILGLVEFILKVVEFLANSISYARLGVLMLVHASLLILVKIALAQGLIGIPIVILWNIAVLLVEGLIVYIQNVRLHLYEWFSKFYTGTGVSFQKLIPETVYVNINWKKKNK